MKLRRALGCIVLLTAGHVAYGMILPRSLGQPCKFWQEVCEEPLDKRLSAFIRAQAHLVASCNEKGLNVFKDGVNVLKSSSSKTKACAIPYLVAEVFHIENLLLKLEPKLDSAQLLYSPGLGQSPWLGKRYTYQKQFLLGAKLSAIRLNDMRLLKGLWGQLVSVPGLSASDRAELAGWFFGLTAWSAERYALEALPCEAADQGCRRRKLARAKALVEAAAIKQPQIQQLMSTGAAKFSVPSFLALDFFGDVTSFRWIDPVLLSSEMESVSTADVVLYLRKVRPQYIQSLENPNLERLEMGSIDAKSICASYLDFVAAKVTLPSDLGPSCVSERFALRAFRESLHASGQNADLDLSFLSALWRRQLAESSLNPVDAETLKTSRALFDIAATLDAIQPILRLNEDQPVSADEVLKAELASVTAVNGSNGEGKP